MTDKEIEDFDLRERKCEMDIESNKKQLEVYETRLKGLKVPQLTAEEKQKLKDLEKMINSRSQELNKIHAEHHQVETEVHELHDRIMNIGGEELKTAKWKMDEATELMSTLEERRAKARWTIKGFALGGRSIPMEPLVGRKWVWNRS